MSNKKKRFVAVCFVVAIAVGIFGFMFHRHFALWDTHPPALENGARKFVEETVERFGQEVEEADHSLQAECPRNEGEETHIAELTDEDGMKIAGTVCNRDGKGIVGARVLIKGDKPETFFSEVPDSESPSEDVEKETQTDKNGWFEVKNLEEGYYRITVTAEGYAPTSLRGVKAGTTDVTITLLQGAIIYGRVTRKDNGSPVRDAEVRVNVWEVERGFHNGDHYMLHRWESYNRTVKTDEDGQYIHEFVPAGDVSVSVYAAGTNLAKDEVEFEVKDGERRKVNFSLPVGGCVSGVVTDAATGMPIEGATVTLWGEERDYYESDKTDEKGFYRISGVLPGRVRISAAKEGYKHVIEKSEQVIVLEEGVEITVNIQLSRGAVVSGRVTDTTGMPVSGASVGITVRVSDSSTRSWGSVGRTDENGEFFISGIDSGTAWIEVTHPEYVKGKSHEFEVREGQWTTGINVVLTRGGSVSGRVLNEKGKPLGRAEVVVLVAVVEEGGGWSWMEEEKAGTTDKSGAYRIRGLRPGQKHLVARVGGYAPGSVENVQVIDGMETTGIDIVLPEGLMISGTVRDQRGNPVEDAQVSVWPSEARGDLKARVSRYGMTTSSTDLRGHYKITGLAQGRYEVNVNAEGYKHAERDNVPAGSTSVDFILIKLGGIAGRVINCPPGRVEMEISLYGKEARLAGINWPFATYSQESFDGTFEIVVDDPGTYTVEVKVEGHGFGRAENVVVKEGEVTGGVVIELEWGTKLVVRVVNKTRGTPIEGATVLIHEGSAVLLKRLVGRGEGNKTGPDGSFTIDGLKPGNYMISAEHPDFARGSVTVTVRAGQGVMTVEILLGQGGTVRGTVYNDDGRPEAGVKMGIVNPLLEYVAETISDASGRFEFTKIPEGEYVIMRDIDDHRPSGMMKIVRVKVKEGEVTEVNLGEKKDGCRLYGVVMRYGQPLARAWIQGCLIGQRTGTIEGVITAKADEQGRYEIRNVAPGMYMLEVSGSDPHCRFIIHVEVGKASEQRFDIIFPEGVIRGSIRDGATGSPVEGARVSLERVQDVGASILERYGMGFDRISDASGSYVFENVPAGTYRVHAIASGYGRATVENVRVAEGETVSGVDLFLSAGGAVYGVVRDASGAGIPSAMVFLKDSSGAFVMIPTMGLGAAVATDENGRFTIVGLKPGKYDMIVRARGYAISYRRGVSVKTEQETQVDFVLSTGGTLELRVTDNLGAAVGGALVEIWDGNVNLLEVLPSLETVMGGGWEILTDVDGMLVVEQVPSGSFTLKVNKEGYKAGTASVVIREGARTVVSVMLEKSE